MLLNASVWQATKLAIAQLVIYLQDPGMYLPAPSESSIVVCILCIKSVMNALCYLLHPYSAWNLAMILLEQISAYLPLGSEDCGLIYRVIIFNKFKTI